MSHKHNKKQQSGSKRTKLYVDGMHCGSCELLIERRFSQIPGVKNADASLAKREVSIEHTNQLLDLTELNQQFSELGYSFTVNRATTIKKIPLIAIQNDGSLAVNKTKLISLLKIIGIVGLILLAFGWFEGSGLAGSVSVSSSSSLLTFFLFGLVAGASSCAALVGGLLLSMSKTWHDTYALEGSMAKHMQPYLLFNSGRLLSFFLLGGVLGLLGSAISISLEFSAVLVIVVSLLMLSLGLQMLGIGGLERLQVRPPKFITRAVGNEQNFNGRYMPFALGAATFLLPCGFTVVAQGVALTSGSFVSGALIMGAFALGTLPVLALISVGSLQFNQRPAWTANFQKVAGILVLFFALFTLNSQLVVLGLPNLKDLHLPQISLGASAAAQPATTATQQDGVQVLKMQASIYGYKPNSFVVKAGQPVRWEIEGVDSMGCAAALIARGLTSGITRLQKGANVIEFQPTAQGTYTFSCTMGMFTGKIEVV